MNKMMTTFIGIYVFAVLLLTVSALKSEVEYITYMSMIKLENIANHVRLHSHEVKYGSGSGQQSVTGTENRDDANSHWQILPALNVNIERGEPVKCGDVIRLMHGTTRCFLHSHNFPSPISRSHQEISCFGKEGEGSDTGDHYKVLCSGDVWMDDDEVRLKHVDTVKYLSLSGEEYGRPISGQKEVVASESTAYNSLWKASEGIYIVPSVESLVHTEL